MVNSRKKVVDDSKALRKKRSVRKTTSGQLKVANTFQQHFNSLDAPTRSFCSMNMSKESPENEVTREDDVDMSGNENQITHDEDTSLLQQTIAPSQGETQQVQKKRGPTQMKNLNEVIAPIDVKFNELGQSLSVTLSSFLGRLVRETVPYTLVDWRYLSDDMKLVMWKDIQQRFKVDEEWQKDYIFKEMGRLWRASKSRLVKKIREAPNEAERMKLKPDNILEPQQWKKFVKEKTSTDFMTKSKRFREIREKQIPHTCSRKGYARLREDMQKKSNNPFSIGRKEVWTAAHIKKNGEPICKLVEETLENLKDASQHDSNTNIKEDALSKVLGPENSGRLRGIGGGVCYTKYSILTQRESNIAHLKEEQNQLKVQVADMERTINDLLKKQFQENQSEEVSNIQLPSSLSVNTNTINSKCKLLDWTGTGEVVAEGRWSSNNPKILVHHIPLGPNAVRVWVDVAMKLDAFLWRPTSDMTCIEECVGTTVAWPCDKVVIE